MIEKPLIQNPLAGGGTSLEDLARLRGGKLIESINRPSDIGTLRPPPSNLGSTSSGLQQPRPGMGLGFPGMKSLEEGMLFLPDKDNPRSEEEIQAMYKQAQEEAAKQRREGFLGQVVLPGEYSYEQFKATNLYGFKRNPNLPDSAYKDFDVSGVAGFDVETPPPQLPNKPIIDDASMKGLPKTNEPPMFTSINPFQEQFTDFKDQLTDFGDQFSTLGDRLTKVEEGIASLLNKNTGSSFNSMQPTFGYSRYGYSPFSMVGLGSLFGGYYG